MSIDPNTPVYGTNNPKNYTAVVDLDVNTAFANDPTRDTAKAICVVVAGQINGDGELEPASGASLPAGENLSGEAGTASTQLAAANPSRLGLEVQNISANEIGVSEFGDAAISSPGTVTIAPGAVWRAKTSNAVQVIASAAATPYTATAW